MNRSIRAIFLSFLIVTVVAPGVAMAQRAWVRASDIANGVAGTFSGTVAEIPSGGEIHVVGDQDDPSAVVRIVVDAVGTRYLGFGRERGDVFVGSSGFDEVREGDRIEVRGRGQGGASILAGEILLLGRDVGPGGTTTLPIERRNVFEGVVRSVEPSESRFSFETARRLVTVYGDRATPVEYGGRIYRIANLESGDEVTVHGSWSASEGIEARRIVVKESRTAPAPEAPSERMTVASLRGTVVDTNARLATFRIDTGRRLVLVDGQSMVGENGERIRVNMLREGEVVELTGRMEPEAFRASSLRYVPAGEREPRATRAPAAERRPAPRGEERPAPRPIAPPEGGDLERVVIYGTVSAVGSDTSLLIVRDDAFDRVYEIVIDPELLVEERPAVYVPASRLREGDRLVIRAVRLGDRLVAQVIRIR